MKRAYLLCPAILLLAASAFAQQPAAAAALAQVQSKMFQRTVGTKPFHLHASVHLDSPVKGQAADGEYDEIWLDPGNWQRVFTLGDRVQDAYSKGGVEYTTMPLEPVATLKQLNDPLTYKKEFVSLARISDSVLPEFLAANQPDLAVTEVKSQAGTLQQIGIGTPSTGPLVRPGYAWLMLPSGQLVTIITSGTSTNLKSTAPLAGKTVPAAVEISQMGKPVIDIKLTAMSLLAAGSQPLIDVPAAAHTVPTEPNPKMKPQVVSHVVERIGGDMPHYPASARGNHVQGMVVLDVVVDASGRVTSVTNVFSPDPSLTEAARASVQTYRYLPAMVSGHPVAVACRIAVNFTLS